MRFYNFLNEEETGINPFLKEFKVSYQNDNVIWRGHKDKIDTYKVKYRHKDRNPRLLNKRLHKYLDSISQELFGWPVRSQGVFCGGTSLAREWGKPYIFIPLEDYEYIWTTEYIDIYKYYNTTISLTFEEVKKELYTKYKELYKESGLSKILQRKAKFEAIFNCDRYLLINADYWETVKEKMLDEE